MKLRTPRSRAMCAAVPLICFAIAALPTSCQPDYSLWAAQGPSPVAARDEAKLVTGELETLTSKQMAVDVRGEIVLMHVDEDIRVTIDGRKAALRDLERRQFVEVTAREEGTDLVARAVAARSRM